MFFALIFAIYPRVIVVNTKKYGCNGTLNSDNFVHCLKLTNQLVEKSICNLQTHILI